MATDIATLGIKIEASDIKAAVAELNKLEDQAGKSERATNRLTDATKRGATALNNYGGYAVLGAAAATVAFIKSTIDAADNLDKLSTRLGASTEALSEYKHVAELSGVSFETLTMGWQRMTRRVAEAAQGTGEATNALKELGISAVELNQLAPEQQFEVLADSLNGVTSSSDKVRLSMKLFDSEGVALLQTMKAGSAGLRDMRQDARDLGLTIDQETAAAAADFNDDLTRLKGSAAGLGVTLANELLPHLTNISNAMAQAAKDEGLWTALWVGMGGVMAELVGADGSLTATKDSLKEVRSELKNSKDAIENYNRALTEMAENKANPAAIEHISNLLKAEEERAAALEARLISLNAQLEPGKPAAPTATGGMLPEISVEETGEDREAERLQERLESKFGALQEAFMAEQDLILEQSLEREILIDELEANSIGTQAERDALRVANSIQTQKDLTAVVTEEARRRADEEEKQQARGAAAFEKYLSAAASGNKTFFEIQKAYRLSKIAMETPAAIADAFAWGTSVGGPYVGAAAAAVAGLAMASYASQIAGASYGGTGSGGTSSAATVGAAPLPSVNETPTAIEPEEEVRTTKELRVVVESDGPNSSGMRQFAADLAETLRDMGSDTNLVVT